MKLSTFLSHIITAAEQKALPLSIMLERVGKMGYCGVDVEASVILENRKLVREVKDAGFEIASVYVMRDYVNGFCAEDEKPLLSALKDAGCRRLMVIPGFFSSPEREEEELENAVSGIKRLCDMADEYGITVTVENFDSADSPCMRVNNIGRMLKAIPALMYTLDMGNYQPFGENAAEAISRFGKRIAHAHVKDLSERPMSKGDGGRRINDSLTVYPAPAGEGYLPINEYVDSLKVLGYDGYLTVEHFGAVDQEEYLSRSAVCLGKMINQ